MPLVFAAIAPHGSMAIAEWCKPEERALAAKTRAAMEEFGRRFAAAAPDVTVVLTPHNIHVERGMAVVLAGTIAGSLESGATPISMRCPVDRELAIDIAVAVGEAGVQMAAVSYGANDTAAAVFPMDWGTQVPLHFMGGRDDPPKPIVMIVPARDLPWDAHVAAGRAIAKAADASGKRVALIASCDHGHAHDPKGPYGFSPASKEFDDRVVELVKRDALAELLRFDKEFVGEAKADSFWQMLMLHGAIADRWHGDFLSYEAPTYFGMLCAAYAPKD
ncbi:MAG: extradiol ring-cleavage dioxygenase [Chloroflexota bacterium]|nr:extradiol ring-cleavage dioxygenase [Chloroflexota bacterium]